MTSTKNIYSPFGFSFEVEFFRKLNNITAEKAIPATGIRKKNKIVEIVEVSR